MDRVERGSMMIERHVEWENSQREREVGFFIPSVESTSACSSLGFCLNFMLPKCITPPVNLYTLIFSSGVKPRTSKASCEHMSTEREKEDRKEMICAAHQSYTKRRNSTINRLMNLYDHTSNGSCKEVFQFLLQHGKLSLHTEAMNQNMRESKCWLTSVSSSSSPSSMLSTTVTPWHTHTYCLGSGLSSRASGQHSISNNNKTISCHLDSKTTV